MIDNSFEKDAARNVLKDLELLKQTQRGRLNLAKRLAPRDEASQSLKYVGYIDASEDILSQYDDTEIRIMSHKNVNSDLSEIKKELEALHTYLKVEAERRFYSSTDEYTNGEKEQYDQAMYDVEFVLRNLERTRNK